ncbi:leucine-rich repeat-containing protein 9-like [Styela clava]
MTQDSSPRDNEDIIKEICVSNGFQYSQLASNGTSIKKLEMFFSGFPRIVGLVHFPHLTSLIIVGQTISKIENLEHCPELRELWIAECQLKTIHGLENNKRISKLYLYDNQIEKIENIAHLHALDILWLSKNKLKRIENVENLKWLQELNVAGNQIQSIGHSMDNLSHLHVLNLSGNKLSSLKDITHLTKLTKLVDLSFKDPLYSCNPVCLLCNYSTHILYHLPKLVRLDSLDVSSPQMRELAEATVQKKKMYYNMRVKNTRRNLTTLQNRLNKDRRLLLQVPEERLRTIHFALKSIEQQQQSEIGSEESNNINEKEGSESSEDEIDDNEAKKPPDELGAAGESDSIEIKANKPDAEVDMHVEQIKSKIESLKQRITHWKNKIEEIEEYHKQALDQVKALTSISVDRLMLELETGGNVRFEQGSTKDVWFTTCHDLILSRFCAWDYKSYGVTGIKTHAITRVHNRLLRSRFDEKVHELACDETGFMMNKNYKKLVDYLFYVPDPTQTDNSKQVENILENGFSNEFDAAVPLSNSLFICEKRRLDDCISQAKENKFPDSCPFRHGSVIIAKVFLGKSAPAQDIGKITQEKYYKIDSVYRLRSELNHAAAMKTRDDCECSSRQCEWHILDKYLVLPEYVIDFEYHAKNPPSPFRLVNYIANNWTSHLNATNSGNSTTVYASELEQDNASLEMSPQIRPRPRIVSLSEDLLLKMGRAMSVSQITVLNLHGNGLGRLKGIGTLSQLKHLVVSFNELTRLEDIAHMPNLVEVDASFNKINSLEGMRGMSKLKTLNLSWNQLTSLRDDLTVMRKHCPLLSTLDIRSNPWIKADNLYLRVIGRLKSLTKLNGIDVTESDAASALRLVSGSRISQATIINNSRVEGVKPRSLSLLSSSEVFHDMMKLKPDAKDATWMTKVVVLNLDGQYIGKLSGLDKLENLRFASFNKNCVTKLEGLECCTNLQELSLVDNCIYKLDGLSKLTNLRHLDLSSNYLISLENSGLEKLTSLQFLSLENNRLTSLKGLHEQHSLVELYLGNNRIVNVREIFNVKALVNLMILDVYGNPVVQSDNYRLFVIYHLPNLKALDGSAIETTEESAAKDAFGGRLTTDFVAERLGHANFTEVRELDFPHCSIRTVDLGNGDAFKNLRSVNVENNSLTSFSGLINLRHLRVLCLNHNHIECIVQRPKNLKQQIRSQYSVSHQVATELLSPERLSPVMESLEVLHLGYNKINNMGGLQLGRLVNLKALFLQGNEISKIEGLEGLHELRELVLDRNKVKVIGENSFANQWNLQELHIEENRIRDLGNLHHLENLQRLYLGMNRIQDMMELEKMESLPNLIELSVIGNAVSRRLLHRPMLVFQQPNLQSIDGIPVTPEERTKAELYFMDQQPNPSNMETILPGITPHNRAGPIKVTHMPVTNDRHTIPYSGHYDDHDHRGTRKHGSKDHRAYHTAIPQGSIYSQLAGVKYQQQQHNHSSNHNGTKTYPTQSNNRGSGGNRYR